MAAEADDGEGARERDVSVQLDWQGDLRFLARAGEWTTEMDGDTERATSPVQMLLESVGGCAAVDMIHILRKGRQEPTGLEVRVSADRAEEHPRRLTRLEVRFELTGDVERAAAERAARLSFETYCSCYQSLRPDIELDYRVTIDRQGGEEDR